MNEDHGLTRENLLCSLPIALSGDLKTAALARTIAGALAERREEIERLAIYPNTAKLEEGLLDILARDFKVDWWDSDYSVEEKRRTLATSWQVHKTLGTKAAVIKAITSVYPSAALEEWFEYGGEPYRFRLSVRLSENGWDASKHRQLLEKMQYYKNLRSHREAVMYYMPLVTVENPQRFLFESLLISGRFAPNIQRAERAGLLMRWAALQALTVGAAFLARARGKNPDILRHTGTLIRGRLPPNRQVPAMSALLLALRAAQSYGARGALLARLKGENQQKARLCRLLLGPYTVDVMGLEAARFDGVHHFDGQRSFWYTFKRRPAFQSMSIQARTANLERISGSILLNPKGPAQNRISGVLRGRYRVRDSTRSLPGHSGTAVRAKIKNINTVTACFTADSMWRFDGAYTFGGERRFNAKIERSEL